jgi:hypothetical protein
VGRRISENPDRKTPLFSSFGDANQTTDKEEVAARQMIGLSFSSSQLPHIVGHSTPT